VRRPNVPKKDQRIIQSLDKGLILLELLEQAETELSLNDLFKTLKWDRATILRLLETLSRRGYVMRSPETRRYSLGYRVLSLSQSVAKNLDVQAISRPHLIELARETGETAHLAVAVDDRMIFVDRALGSHTVTVNTRVGERVPLHCTAIGKAYLAFGEGPGLAESLSDPLPPGGPRAFQRRSDLLADLEKTRVRGYSVDMEEFLEGVRCVAAPIVNSEGRTEAVIGISAPKARMSAREIAEKAGQVVACSKRISDQLGHREDHDENVQIAEANR
jgi:DNA-binding IclR family transcriptional regulator